MSMKAVVPLIAVIAILTVFSSYVFGILSDNGDNINVEDTGYQEAYESNVRIQSASSTLLTPIAIMLGIVGLVLVIGQLRKYK